MFTQPSLFKRLMFSVLTLSFILWCLVLFFLIHEMKKIPERFSGINLESVAQQQLAAFKAIQNDEAINRYADENDRLQQQLYKKLSVFVSQYHLQVWRGDQLIYSYKNLPTEKPQITDLAHLSGLNIDKDQKPWLSWSEQDSTSGMAVRVVQEPSLGFSLSYRSVGFYLIPFLVSVPFLFFPVWWAISRGLRPLNQVAAEIVARTDVNLTNISPTKYRELSPIVNAINRLMGKINDRIQREQEFLHDAAHELKTPLAVIQLNSEVLANARDSDTQKMALIGINKGVVRATRTTHQLLAAARTQNYRADTSVKVAINFSQLLQDRLALWMTFALPKNIDIELNAPVECLLNVHVESIALLVDNLIDNAIKYSPPNSSVKVNLLSDAFKISLSVIDEGSGIPQQYREKVFERFFRLNHSDLNHNDLNHSDNHGTGLGLSIVKRAAQEHGATIELSDNLEAGHGLVVTVSFYLDQQQ